MLAFLVRWSLAPFAASLTRVKHAQKTSVSQREILALRQVFRGISKLEPVNNVRGWSDAGALNYPPAPGSLFRAFASGLVNARSVVRWVFQDIPQE